MKKRIYIEAKGCTRRLLDASKFKRYFLLNGFSVTGNAKKADYLLFITCAFRKKEQDYMVHRIKELSRHSGKLIVGGCLKGIAGEELSQNFSGPAFVTSDIEYLDKLFPDSKIKFKDLAGDCNLLHENRINGFIESVKCHLYEFISKRISVKDFAIMAWLAVLDVIKGGRGYFYLRICWGCIGAHCAYCDIWKAIGRLKSKPLKHCLEEFRSAVKNRYKKIVIVADNTGAYGLDINLTFAQLLKSFVGISGKYGICIEDLNPVWIIKYLDELIPAIETGKIKDILVPIQSGNNRILKLMNRGYDVFQLKEALAKIVEVSPGINIYTHILIGFPSETDSEFKETLSVVRDIGFKRVGIFDYTKNASLPPSFLDGQMIPGEIVRERVRIATEFFKKHKIMIYG